MNNYPVAFVVQREYRYEVVAANKEEAADIAEGLLIEDLKTNRTDFLESDERSVAVGEPTR